MSDKRRHPRFSTQLPATVRHLGRLIPAMIKNVSTGGLFVTAESNDFSSSSPVEVMFNMNGSEGDLSMMGRVRHLERTDTDASFGVQFTSAFADGVKKVLSFCASKSS